MLVRPGEGVYAGHPKPYEQIAAEKAMAFEALDSISYAATGKPWHIVGTDGIVRAYGKWAWLRSVLRWIPLVRH